jgi:hypothetical protein
VTVLEHHTILLGNEYGSCTRINSSEVSQFDRDLCTERGIFEGIRDKAQLVLPRGKTADPARRDAGFFAGALDDKLEREGFPGR